MPKLEPRIYKVRITFGHQHDWLAKLVHDLEIEPEFGHTIEEGDWGLWRTLEIWVQEASPQSLLLHVQKAHYKRNKTYLFDLQCFFDRLAVLGNVRKIEFLQEGGQN